MRHLNHHQYFSARVGWLVLGILFFFLLIFTRLVEIQLFRGQYFLDLANANRYFTISLPAERGIFFDRYQQSLVWNKRTYLDNFIFSEAFSLKYKNSGNVNATATKKVNGISNHQYLIFKRIDSGIINTKKVRTTTVKSAPKDLPAKLACASLKKLVKVGSFAV
jgi:cell division protein FtsI/penicillin-binding protein 2